ncbi:hypothetical protein OIU76_006215 [Salix suchowensis]|nr:hypothetical protein OIU76_006215 [Salix suchowensis]
MEGFVKYLVDSKLVFDTLERIVDKSDDVSYAYFRKTGLERSEGLAKDLEWFSQRNIEIPEPSTPGTSYVKYLEELAEDNAPLFLSHFYNIYFSHIAGGQVISRKVSDKLLQGRELEFYRWGGDAQELLKGVREKLNMLGEHWTRDEKNKCLKEAAKLFCVVRNACFSYGLQIALLLLWTDSIFIPKVVNYKTRFTSFSEGRNFVFAHAAALVFAYDGIVLSKGHTA